MESSKYFQNYYAKGLKHVQRDSILFYGALAMRHPELFVHLQSMDVHPLMFVTPWFMCAFTALPLWDTTLAIWDMLFWTGRKAIFRGTASNLLVI